MKTTSIWEHILYEDQKLNGGEYAFYNMTVGRRFYTGTQHLVVRLIADSFDSDPDVYISKTNKNPKSSEDEGVLWYCETQGSETCILHNGDF